VSGPQRMVLDGTALRVYLKLGEKNEL